MIQNLTVGVTTIAFSKNVKLMNQLNSLGFKKVKKNEAGKRFTTEELVSFLKDCDVAIIGLDLITEEVLAQIPSLKAISKYGVGLDNIDFEACEKHNIKVFYPQGVNKRSVSEMTLGFMLSLCRNLYVTSNLLKNSIWNKSGGMQLSEKTIGIIGVGHIGKDVISLLKPFNCKILVNDIISQKEYYKANNLTHVSKEEIFKNADIITIHTPLTDKTKNLFNKSTLSLMKETSFVINTARGGLFNQDDLKKALIAGDIAGAAMDVYDIEPPTDLGLLGIPNLMNTPHIGGNSKEAVQAMGEAAIERILDFFNS
ncbi:phosphoglycerate dehydrogenase [Aquimarina aquimarini]|uniref:phosphoglycerate dehydrogenase n=1 Tax=Aquimarina aquimarini TaxID=1191734 RepID=UPI00190066E2|nr:phosphoglycerate dehydrogenase [Aquimarina aquimarini]